MGITRRQLRRDVLKDLGDHRTLTATRDGSDVTFYDSLNLVGEVDAFRGREVMFTGGTPENLGQIRHVNGSSATHRYIGWGTALPAETAEGDEAELINVRSIGHRFQDVHEAINATIRGIGRDALVPAGSDEQIFARGSSIVIPAEFRTVEDLQVRSDDPEAALAWRAVPKATRPNGHGWWVDRASRTVIVGGSLAAKLDGRTVKLWGLAEPAELNDDDDETELDPEWLVLAVQARLARSRYMRAPTPETERLMYILNQKADGLRRRIVASRSPFSERL